MGVHIQLTNNSLTKQVTFTPFYITSNQCPFAIDVQEMYKLQQTWIKVYLKLVLILLNITICAIYLNRLIQIAVCHFGLKILQIN